MTCCCVASASKGNWHQTITCSTIQCSLILWPFLQALPAHTTHACFCILTSSDEGIEILHINDHQCSHDPIDSDGPRPHASMRVEHTWFPGTLRMVAMSLRVMVLAVIPRAKPLSVTWLHSSFELCRSCTGPTDLAYSRKDSEDLGRMEVSRPVCGGPSQTGSVSCEKSGMTHSIPHLRKNSLLDNISAMPFWHPGDELCSDPV